MVKVFLVEDEAIIRNGIKNNIPWEKEGFDFVGDAGDGELAWPMIRKTRPDILITDIRMPFMNGLELTALVKKELPATRVIVLSGYSEFEYAKQAISLGVTEYLLKPINSEKLLEAIRGVAEHIREEWAQKEQLEQFKKEMQEKTGLEKKRLFDKIVAGNNSTGELLEQGKQIGMDLAASFYTVLLFKIVTQENDVTYSDVLAQAIIRCEEIMEHMTSFLVFERGAEGWAFLLKTESAEQVEPQLAEFEVQIRKIVSGASELSYFGGIGKTVQRMRDIRASYQSASKAFASRFFVERNQFVKAELTAAVKPVQGREVNLQSIDASKIDRRLAESFLNSGLEEEVDDFVEEYFHNIGEENYRSTMFSHYLIVDLNFCACQFLEKLGAESDVLSENWKNVDHLSNYTRSPETMIQYTKQLFAETIRIRDQFSRSRYHDTIEQAKNYVLQNFGDNEFSMNQAAAMVNISPGYFSTLFRQEAGITFVEYLTAVRMNKAKELLMCTNMRSSEIGYQVGYRDSHYFSYIFKKMNGCTPKEYRARKTEGVS